MKLRLYLEICSACNLHCQYCFEEGYHSQYLETERLFSFIGILKEVIEDVVITGGEPMLHPSFLEIVNYIAAFAPVVVTTNGTKVNICEIKELLQAHPNLKIQFSLDAIDENFVDSVRGKGVYSKVISAISQLQDFHSQIGISSTLTRQTPTMIQDIYDFARQNQITCYFPSLLPYGALRKNWTELMPTADEYISSEEKIIELLANDEQNLIQSNKAEWILGKFFAESGAETPENMQYILKVDAKGNIVSCPATDASYTCSKISDIDTVQSIQDLQNALHGYTDCLSAGKSQKCNVCSAEKYCKGVFCGNCIHMHCQDRNVIDFLCETFRHHYASIEQLTENGGNYESD